MHTGAPIPARRALSEAAAINERLGHENLGFLSEERGFLPTAQPLLSLPPTHAVWDDAADRLPELVRTLRLRETLAAMPVLGADSAQLPDRYLLRASVILSMLAHANYYVETDPPAVTPPSVATPWQEVTRRLDRPAPHISFFDMAYNWRVIDAGVPQPFRVENLELLVPMVGNEDERRFQMTPIETLARSTPVVGAVVRAQEAIVRSDLQAARREVALLADVIHQLADAFTKVNPNRYSRTYVNPVVWGKTVAPFTTPIEAGVPASGGTGIPTFQLLDIVFGRRNYASSVGQETDMARRWLPRHWRAFLDAVEAVPFAEFVARSGDRELQGLFREALDAYAGKNGFLGRHRVKVYGYLDLSFKAGRTRTLGGFAGGFADRVWDHTDGELESARHERYVAHPQTWHHVAVKGVRPLRDDPAAWVGHVIVNVDGAGIRYPAGGRCAVLPENEPALVERTVQSLRAGGDEAIELDAAWREAVGGRTGYATAKVLTLRTLLRFGHIRPVDRATAKQLLAVSHDAWLARIVERRAEDQWELWELLDSLGERGFNPKQLWKAHVGERENICRIVPPERPRLYSISSAMEDPTALGARELHLTLGRLRYPTEQTNVSVAGTRHGTASSFLSRNVHPTAPTPLSIKVVRPTRFALPANSDRPIVMFAGGTGLAPFRSLIQERSNQLVAGASWLFFATRTRADLYHGNELAEHVEAGRLNLRVAFSAEDVRLADPAARGGELLFQPGHRCHIDEEMIRDDNALRLWRLIDAQDAVVYVCGQAGFASAVMRGMRAVLARFADGTEHAEQGRQRLYQLMGDRRYLQEVYTTYTGAHVDQERCIDASDVVIHNNDRDGHWMIINGRVYDLTDFAPMHPGGDKIIRSYTGMDATVAYKRVLHDVNPEVDSMLGMHEIGVVRRLDLGSSWCVAVSRPGLRVVTAKDLYRMWISQLYMTVEMQNAVSNDYAVRTEPVTHDEHVDEVRQSPYKTQLLFQAHQRFLRDYLAALTSEALERLWATTAAVGGSHHPVGWMRVAITASRQSEAARRAELLDQRVAAALSARTDLAYCIEWCARIEEEDKRFLADMKHGLRQGVQVFERWQGDALTTGSHQLITAVQALPSALDRYFTALAGIESSLHATGESA